MIQRQNFDTPQLPGAKSDQYGHTSPALEPKNWHEAVTQASNALAWSVARLCGTLDYGIELLERHLIATSKVCLCQAPGVMIDPGCPVHREEDVISS